MGIRLTNFDLSFLTGNLTSRKSGSSVTAISGPLYFGDVLSSDVMSFDDCKCCATALMFNNFKMMPTLRWSCESGNIFNILNQIVNELGGGGCL